jgi:hypothetical protein
MTDYGTPPEGMYGKPKRPNGRGIYAGPTRVSKQGETVGASSFRGKNFHIIQLGDQKIEVPTTEFISELERRLKQLENDNQQLRTRVQQLLTTNKNLSGRLSSIENADAGQLRYNIG